ncbi:hypothetical protein [Edaphobacter bradus]|uniref:hypothetical protein n=1 Tax=Edaphobacter bradus TaxID=2259016 RepID=UPI0021DF9522|nr:hypothetical protein [Edaphobacter bradus]
MLAIWTFLTVHWGIIVSVCTVSGGLVGYGMGLWKSKTDIKLSQVQIDKLTLELEQARLNIETKAVAQMVLIMTDRRKVEAGTQNLAFDFDDLWCAMGEPYALRLHAAINMLTAEGRAKRAEFANEWIFT